jgi:polysaccharide deacetylase 2 family uncharacterized protein YibQ
MKLFKRLLKGLLIFLIVVFIAAIAYMIQWKEVPIGGAKEPKKETGQAKIPAVVPPEGKTAPVKEKPALPAKEKEKIVISKIEKIPVPLRQITIIIDDIGYDLGPVRELIKIDADITFAILPLCSHSKEAAEMLHNAGKETLLHLPMEPNSYPKEKPGNGALFTDMNDKELLYQLDKDLASVPFISGVNNHMGSKFMGDEEKLELIFGRLKKRNLFFIDSRTAANSKASIASGKVGLQWASRKIFLDNSRNYDEIYKKLVDIAHNTDAGDISPIIIIGHPYPETIRAIRNAASFLRQKGVLVVPASKLVKEKAVSGAS